MIYKEILAFHGRIEPVSGFDLICSCPVAEFDFNFEKKKKSTPISIAINEKMRLTSQ